MSLIKNSWNIVKYIANGALNLLRRERQQSLIEDPFQGERWALEGALSLAKTAVEKATIMQQIKSLDRKEIQFYAEERLERYEEALGDYNRSLELRPDDPNTLNNRGLALESLERYQEALGDYNRSLELRPDDPNTLANRGVTLVRLERYEEALADYNHSLELRPDDTDTLYSIARLYSLIGRYGEAMDLLEKIVTGDDKYLQMASRDEDFTSLRSHTQLEARFRKLISGDLGEGE